MTTEANSKKQPKRRHSDLVGIDFGTTSTKVVRLKYIKGELSLAGIDVLPAVDFSTTASRMQLPRSLAAYYGCLAYGATSGTARIVSSPLEGSEDTLPEPKLRELLNVDDSYRVSGQLVKRGKGRQESSFLAAAIPEADVRFMLNMFPAGPPAPMSVEVAGLAFVTSFLHSRGAECANEAVCLLEAGEVSSSYAILNQNKVALVGKLNFGCGMLRQKLAADFGVDDDLAASILNDHSIDISGSVGTVLDPFLKQFTISKDFIERHQGCRVGKVYISGGLSLLPGWVSEVEKIVGIKVVRWSPLENIKVDENVLPLELEQQTPRFAVAIGAAIGGFEEE